jgi:hypothetical protein
LRVRLPRPGCVATDEDDSDGNADSGCVAFVLGRDIASRNVLTSGLQRRIVRFEVSLSERRALREHGG